MPAGASVPRSPAPCLPLHSPPLPSPTLGTDDALCTAQGQAPTGTAHVGTPHLDFHAEGHGGGATERNATSTSQAKK